MAELGAGGGGALRGRGAQRLEAASFAGDPPATGPRARGGPEAGSRSPLGRALQDRH